MNNLKKLSAVCLMGAMLALGGCSGSSEDNNPGNHNSDNHADNGSGDINAIKQSGVLTVVTRNAPTSYYLGRNAQPTGPEYSLATAFAKHLDVKAEFVVKDSVAAVLQTLKNGKADMAAAGITETAGRAQKYIFGPHYQQVTQQVVCRAKGNKAKNIAQLKNVNLDVIADSSYEERLRELRKQHPALAWDTNAKVGTEQLLRQVWKKEIDCTVADSNIVDINRRYYPQLLVMFDLDKPQPLAWAMPGGSQGLREAAQAWFKDYKSSGQLAAVLDTYYGYIPEFDYVDKSKLIKRIDQRYAKYDHLFEKAADKHDIPATLLAAQAYQESHWDPNAKSATGVRGIMMLTRKTAKSLGVKDRLDPKQSIAGGARYLEKMQSKLDDSIGEPERTYFALAAYNIGFAHLRDAQRLTSKMGKDPQAWSEVRKVLPLLADKRYYPKLKYGYARGTEPVRYIDRIRDYEDVIAKYAD